MSHFSNKPLTEQQFELIESLDNLNISGPLDVVQKTSSTSLSNTTLVAGSNISLTPGPGTITIESTGGGGGGTPASPDTSVQFNNGGVFGGDANFTWDNVGKQLYLGDPIINLEGDEIDILTASKDFDSYIAVNVKNTNNGGEASSDFVVLSDIDDGTIETGTYGDFFIAGSNYNSLFIDQVNQPNDVCLLSSPGAGNLNIIATGSGKKIQFATEGDSVDNVAMDITSDTVNIYATKGADISVPLTVGNWTLISGAVFLTSPDRIAKTSNGTTTVQSIGATTVVGQLYKVVIDVTITSGSISVSIGGNPLNIVATTYQYMMSSTGVYTFYIGANDTTGIYFSTITSSSRWEINSVVCQPVVSGTGDTLIEGNTQTNDLKISGGIIAGRNRVYWNTTPKNNVVLAHTTRIEAILSGTVDLTGLYMGQVDGTSTSIINFTASYRLTIKNASALSTDSNRFQTSTNQDIVLDYGEEVKLIYNAGSPNRWFVEKVNTAALQFNGLTNGYAFGDWLNTLLSNSNQMTIGLGRAVVKLDNLATYTSMLGDADNSGNKTKIIIDDANTFIKNEAQSYWLYKELGSDYFIAQLINGDGNFNTRFLNFAGSMLIKDSLSIESQSPEPSAILELRVEGADQFRGFLMPKMTSANRDTIPSPTNGLMVITTDDGINATVGISTYDAANGAWVTDYKARYSVGALPTTAAMGDRAIVTDEQDSGFGKPANGGGGLVSPVYYDGSVWRCG